MSNIKAGQLTVKAFAALIVLVNVLFAIMCFGLMPSSYWFFSALGQGIATIVSAVILLTELFFDGRKPNLKKDLGAQIALGVSLIVLTFALITIFTPITIAGVWLGVYGTLYVILAILLAKELMTKR
jgi:hypothetical protein